MWEKRFGQSLYSADYNIYAIVGKMIKDHGLHQNRVWLKLFDSAVNEVIFD